MGKQLEESLIVVISLCPLRNIHWQSSKAKSFWDQVAKLAGSTAMCLRYINPTHHRQGGEMEYVKELPIPHQSASCVKALCFCASDKIL